MLICNVFARFVFRSSFFVFRSSVTWTEGSCVAIALSFCNKHCYVFEKCWSVMCSKNADQSCVRRVLICDVLETCRSVMFFVCRLSLFVFVCRYCLSFLFVGRFFSFFSLSLFFSFFRFSLVLRSSYCVFRFSFCVCFSSVVCSSFVCFSFFVLGVLFFVCFSFVCFFVFR